MEVWKFSGKNHVKSSDTSSILRVLGDHGRVQTQRVRLWVPNSLELPLPASGKQPPAPDQPDLPVQGREICTWGPYRSYNGILSLLWGLPGSPRRKQTPTPLGTPDDLRHGPAAGSYGGAFCYKCPCAGVPRLQENILYESEPNLTLVFPLFKKIRPTG